jgi:metal-responsive CopG/Arc/MetJ family transcriptional regulator
MRSIRLNKELEEELARLASQKEVSRSEIIKEAIQQYITTESQLNNPYELGEKYFGQYSSTETDMSVTYKSRIRDKIRNKRTKY